MDQTTELTISAPSLACYTTVDKMAVSKIKFYIWIYKISGRYLELCLIMKYMKLHDYPTSIYVGRFEMNTFYDT